MRNSAIFLSGGGRGTDVFDILQRLDRPIVEVRGDHHRTSPGTTTQDGDRFPLGGVEIAALLAAELARGGSSVHAFGVHHVQVPLRGSSSVHAAFLLFGSRATLGEGCVIRRTVLPVKKILSSRDSVPGRG